PLLQPRRAHLRRRGRGPASGRVPDPAAAARPVAGAAGHAGGAGGGHRAGHVRAPAPGGTASAGPVPGRAGVRLPPLPAVRPVGGGTLSAGRRAVVASLPRLLPADRLPEAGPGGGGPWLTPRGAPADGVLGGSPAGFPPGVGQERRRSRRAAAVAAHTAPAAVSPAVRPSTWFCRRARRTASPYGMVVWEIIRYSGCHRSPSSRCSVRSVWARSRCHGLRTRSRSSMKLSAARSAITSVWGLRRCS